MAQLTLTVMRKNGHVVVWRGSHLPASQEGVSEEAEEETTQLRSMM